ncbi:MAG: hypothetical protein QOF78_3819 [Phycisphaerales bacterium]|jgi:hypothetical protein|nr:hypothetical protein [Phycisphaerales bacterium]
MQNPSALVVAAYAHHATLEDAMANPDLDELLNALIPFAQQMLAEHGEFFPFGASMDAKGESSVRAGIFL